jgi:hypothetical protein
MAARYASALNARSVESPGMGVRLDAADEYMHEVGPEPNFNESMYFNVIDPGSGVGGFFRVGNRPNEGTGEMTVCLYLPGGRVGFMFKRPEVTSNDAFDSAGLRFTVVEPFEELTIDYDGKVVLLDDPLQLADPKAAFTSNPYAAVEVHLRIGRASAMFGGEPDEPHERPGGEGPSGGWENEFARGHYEQLITGTGSMKVGDEEWAIDGFGLRDHSWGPRYWQAPWYYRWLTANVGKDFGFMLSRIARRDGEGTRGGFVWQDGKLHLCDGCEITTTWSEPGTYHETIKAKLTSSRAERSWDIEGKVQTMVPLRNRRQTPDGEWLHTRIGEGLTQWRVEGVDGTGWGLSEYLDQIVDDRPVGLAE